MASVLMALEIFGNLKWALSWEMLGTTALKPGLDSSLSPYIYIKKKPSSRIWECHETQRLSEMWASSSRLLEHLDSIRFFFSIVAFQSRLVRLCVWTERRRSLLPPLSLRFLNQHGSCVSTPPLALSSPPPSPWSQERGPWQVGICRRLGL